MLSINYFGRVDPSIMNHICEYLERPSEIVTIRDMHVKARYIYQKSLQEQMINILAKNLFKSFNQDDEKLPLEILHIFTKNLLKISHELRWPKILASQSKSIAEKMEHHFLKASKNLAHIRTVNPPFLEKVVDLLRRSNSQMAESMDKLQAKDLENQSRLSRKIGVVLSHHLNEISRALAELESDEFPSLNLFASHLLRIARLIDDLIKIPKKEKSLPSREIKSFIRDPVFWRSYFKRMFASDGFEIAHPHFTNEKKTCQEVCKLANRFYGYPDPLQISEFKYENSALFTEAARRGYEIFFLAKFMSMMPFSEFFMLLKEAFLNKKPKAYLEIVKNTPLIFSLNPAGTIRLNIEQVNQILLWNAYFGTTLGIEGWIARGGDIDTQDQLGNRLLHIASIRGHLSFVQKLINLKANLDKRNQYGTTPLLLAVENDQIEILKALVEAGANKEILNEDGQTPLYISIERRNQEAAKILIHSGANIEGEVLHVTPIFAACYFGLIEIVRLLLNAKVNLDVRDLKGKTVLHYAVISNQLAIAKLLDFAGADPQTKDKEGYTALHSAADMGDEEMVEWLLSKGLNKDAQNLNSITPLFLAASRGHLGTLKILVKGGAKLDLESKNEGMAFHIAAKYDHIHILEELKKAGMDINSRDAKGSTALHYASAYGSVKSIQWLINNGAEIDALGGDKSTPLIYTVYYGHLEAFRLLIQFKANLDLEVDKRGRILHIAAGRDHVEILKELLSMGMDVNLLDKQKISPLFPAAYYESREALKVLIERNADFQLQDKKGDTPLHYAAFSGKAESIKVLISIPGIKLDVQDHNLQTPLYLAAMHGHRDVVDILLEAKANIELREKLGRTPLHIAVKRGFLSIVKKLLQAGANKDVQDNEGVTPLHIAARRDGNVILDELILANANNQVQDQRKWTPLHHAAKAGSIPNVRKLLSAGIDKSIQGEGGTAYEIGLEHGNEELNRLLKIRSPRGTKRQLPTKSTSRKRKK